MNDSQLVNTPLYFEKLRAQENEEKTRRERLTFKTMFIMYDDNINHILSISKKKLRLKECRAELETVKEKIKLREDFCTGLNSTVQKVTEEAEKYKQKGKCLRHNYQELSEELTTMMKNEKRKAEDSLTREVSQWEVELRRKNEELATENLELSELLLQEMRFSVDLDALLCETQTTLLGLQTDWRKLQDRYKEVKVKLKSATQSNVALHSKIHLLSESYEGASSQEPLEEDVSAAPSPESPQGSCDQTSELPGAASRRKTKKKKKKDGVSGWKKFTRLFSNG